MSIWAIGRRKSDVVQGSGLLRYRGWLGYTGGLADPALQHGAAGAFICLAMTVTVACGYFGRTGAQVTTDGQWYIGSDASFHSCTHHNTPWRARSLLVPATPVSLAYKTSKTQGLRMIQGKISRWTEFVLPYCCVLLARAEP